MGYELVVPKSIKSGWCFTRRKFGIGFKYHTLQCDQKWFGRDKRRGCV